MSTHDSHTLHITPLAPVHIGTGETYEPTQYVIDEAGVLHEFDTGAVMAALDERDRRHLLAIAQGRPGREMIKSLQRFFHERRERLIPVGINRIPTLPGFAALHASRIGQAANVESGGRQVLNQLEIQRCAYHAATRKPVLYGSSLKGALRTALLDRENNGRRPFEKKGLHELQGRLFRYRDPECGRQQLERDPMRLVQLGDALWQGPADWPAADVRLAVNRKKAPVRDRHGREIPAMAENLAQFLECVSAFQTRAFRATLNLQRVEAAGASGNLPARELRYSLRQLADACNAFYRPRLTAEIQLMQTRGYVAAAWVDAIDQLIALVKPRIEAGDVFLLRVGRHSGAESVTLNGARRIRIMKGKGQPADEADAARTLWLAAGERDQRADLLPFGWVLVEATPGAADAPAWPALEALCEPWRAEARAFAEREASQRAERAAILARRQAEAATARQQAEQAAARAVAEAERRATLTPNLRRVEDFRQAMAQRAEELRGGKDRQNTQYHQLAQQLARDARESADWTAAEKRAVADAITEWLPRVVDRIDKEALKKLRLAALRGDA